MITKKDLIEIATEYAKVLGKNYGIEAGDLEIRHSDARSAPFNWKLVQYVTRSGEVICLHGPGAGKELYDWIKWRIEIETTKKAKQA